MVGVEKPILLDIPEAFETERLLIRAPRKGDGAVMNEAMAETIHNLRRWLPMPWCQNLQTPAETEESVRRSSALWILREDFRFGLFRKSDGVYIGACGLHRPDWSILQFEIGYWIRASVEGQGYIGEAVAGVNQFAFETLKAERVEIRCDSRNDRSAAVARKAGFTLEATLRHNDTTAHGSTLRDTLLFAMLREEYFSDKSQP